MTPNQIPVRSTVTVEQSETMGFDCAINGPTKTNSHYALFATRALTEAWQRGKEKAEETLRGMPTPDKLDPPRNIDTRRYRNRKRYKKALKPLTDAERLMLDLTIRAKENKPNIEHLR